MKDGRNEKEQLCGRITKHLTESMKISRDGEVCLANPSIMYLITSETIRMLNPRKGNDSYTKIQYLLMFDPDNESNPFIRIDLPCDKVEIGVATSIWTDGIMLAVGCLNEVVMVYLPNMDVEYWTELDTDEVERILEEKRRYGR